MFINSVLVFCGIIRNNLMIVKLFGVDGIQLDKY